MDATKIVRESARKVGARFTTPLLPDDYLSLVNPLWTARELRGRIEEVVAETEDAVTLVIRPGWGWHYDHRPGQYVGIGVQVGGRFHWRSYSVSSPPRRSRGTISITVRAMPEGFLSSHLVSGVRPGTIVRLALPNGDFVLPEPPPARILFLVGGSGITPVMAILRTLDRRGTLPDVVMAYSSPTPERMIFGAELRELADRHPTFHLHEQHTDVHGLLEMDDLDRVCPDWRHREAWACGPAPMLDAIEEHWERTGNTPRLHLERFNPVLEGEAEGGTITFVNSGRSTQADGATTVLEAGEQAGVGMPYGCRMGICHTCTLTLVEGTVRDLRNGNEFSGPNEPVQTCVTAAAGDCSLNI